MSSSNEEVKLVAEEVENNHYEVTQEDEMPNEEAQSTDMDHSSSEEEDDETEYEEVDMRKNELYQVLSMFLEDSNGNNLCESINQLRESLEAQTQAIVSQTQVLFEIGKLVDKKMRRQQQQSHS